MNDPSLELVLSEAAELKEIELMLLEPERLPELWKSDAISVQVVIDFFSGTNVVQVQRDGYMEPLPIPKASTDVIRASVTQAVESGLLWLTNGPASILAEPIPAGVLPDFAPTTTPPSVESQLNERQKAIIIQVHTEGFVTNKWCRENLNVVRDTAHRDLSGLVDLKILERTGQGRATRYVLAR
jgi:hypothetical protein